MFNRNSCNTRLPRRLAPRNDDSLNEFTLLKLKIYS